MNIRQYLSRLYNAILGREFKEGRYFWNLDEYILELVTEYIDWNRCWHPTHTTKKLWEKKLQRLKTAILDYNKLDDDWLAMQKNKIKYIADIQKNERIIKKELWDVLFNLWD